MGRRLLILFIGLTQQENRGVCGVFAVITLFPEMFEAITAYGISGRAAKRDIVQVTCINPRDFAEGNYRRVDERPFGGGLVW